jgi:hypothetical protein
VRVSSRAAPGIAHERPFGDPVQISSVEITIHSLAGTLWNGVPVPLTVTGSANNAGQGEPFFIGSNGKFQRGTPLFSERVEAGASFYRCDLVRDFPNRTGGPPANRLGGSSFIAASESQNKLWANLSTGAWQLSGGILFDWEYQLRFASGDGTPEAPPTLTIGTVPNSGMFIGGPVPSFSVEFRDQNGLVVSSFEVLETPTIPPPS